MHKLFILCLLVVSCYTSNAQKCTLTFKGKVTDFHDNSPIVGASVHITNLNKYTTTNLDGEFEFKNLCTDVITVEFKHLACETKQIVIKLTKNTFKNITLEHHLEELDEVMVTAEKKTEATSIEHTLKKEVIEKFTDKSLGDALTTISGVSSLNTGNSIVKPMIHGLHSSRLLIMNNNVRMFDQEWGDEHAPNIDINAGGRIHVVKGANTLMYGSDAVGGAIIIKPEKYANKDSIFGSSSLSLNTNGWGGNVNTDLVKTSKKGFYTKFQTSYKKFGDFNAANYNLSNTGVQSLNASFRFGYNSFEKGFDTYYSYVNNSIGILRAAHVGNASNLVSAINRSEPSFVADFSYDINNPRQSIIHHLGKIEAYKRFKGLGKLTLQYDFQFNRRKEFDRRRSNFNHLPAADFKLFTTSLQPNLRIDAIEDLVLNTGFLLRYQQNISEGNNVDVPSTGVSIPLIPNYDKYETGVYAIGNYNLNDDAQVSFGIRYDFARIEAVKEYKVFDWNENNYDELFPEFSTGIVKDFEILTNPKLNFHNVSASLGFTKAFKNDFEFLFNYGLASRTPNVSELFSDGLHHSAARIETGKLNLNKEVAHKLVGSLERQNPNFGFTVSPYYKYINDFIQLIPSGSSSTTIRGAFLEWEYIQIDAQIFGIDVDVTKKISNTLNYNGSISLLRGDNVTDNIPLIHMPSTNFSNKIIYKNEKLNQLTISITQNTELRQNRFPDYNHFIFDLVRQEDVYVDISTPPNAFTLFHFNSSADFKIFKNSNLNVAFAIENIFDVSYRNYLNRLRYFADGVGRNFNIKLKLNY